MSFNFPNSPAVNDSFTPVGGPTYQWDGTVWRMSGTAGALVTATTRDGGIRTTAAKLRGPTTVAKARFNIAPGQVQAVGAKMTRRGKRLMKKPTLPALIANVNIGAGMFSAGSLQVTR